MKKVAILQSNYIPWKGYFDLIAAVDEFIVYDDMQFTKNDWRNRNKLKTPKGSEWISIPVGQKLNRRIRDVVLPQSDWQKKHWKTISCNYSRSAYYKEIADFFEPLYMKRRYAYLSEVNRVFIEAVCRILNINTKISNSWDYQLIEGRTERIVSLCIQSGATEYISGPAAKCYLDKHVLNDNGIKLTWFDYSGYPVYPQLWGDFVHEVSVLDLLFNCGPNASRNIWGWREEKINSECRDNIAGESC